MDDLAGVLRRERELLDQLRFRFIETRLLLAAKEVRYLRWATAEVEQARRRARETDLLRAASLHRAGIKGARGGTPTLREVATAAREPWAGILRDHHEGLCGVVSEIEVIGHRNAELAREGIRCLADAGTPSSTPTWLAALTAEPEGTTATATAPTIILTDEAPHPCATDAGDVTQLASESAYQDVITTASRLRMPALLAFLR